MPSKQLPNKEQLIDGLLHSLHYGNPKEDSVMLKHLRMLFCIPPSADLRDYLIQEIDFSYLFARCMQLAEPCTDMLNQIYTFLSAHRASANTASAQKRTDTELRQLLISENVQDQLSFDLDAFPALQETVLQRLPKKRPTYDLKEALQDMSPLLLMHKLRDFGITREQIPSGYVPCPSCQDQLEGRFQRLFEHLEGIIDGLSRYDIPPHLQERAEKCRQNFNTANAYFRKGLHMQTDCRVRAYWNDLYHTLIYRLEWITTDETWFEQTEALLKFFRLPFWEKRSQLYEVWVLIHFLQCLDHLLPVQLTIRNNMWKLQYANAAEPAATASDAHIELDIWFQKRVEGKVYTKRHCTPDILVMGRERQQNIKMQQLVLIECKEREGDDDIFKLASHYYEQIRAKGYIYCNYLHYQRIKTLERYRRKTEIICNEFRPGSPVLPIVDNYFLEFLNKSVKFWGIPALFP